MFFRTTKAKPAPAKVKAPAVVAPKRKITDRIQSPVSVKNKFYLNRVITCDEAWKLASYGAHGLQDDGYSEDAICRRTGLSLFDVRRLLAGPGYRQVDTQSDGRRTIALHGWDENSIPDGSEDNPTPWEHLYVSPADIARHTGLVHDPKNYIIRFDAGAYTHFVTLAVVNPKHEMYGHFFARRTPSVLKAYIARLWEQVDQASREKDEKALLAARKKAEKAVRDAAEYQRQIDLLKKRR